MAYYFRIPTIEELTFPQKLALDDTEQIALSGGPGTGKSVVSLYRHLANHNNGNQSLLITYTTTLRRYLAECCRLKNPQAANFVRSAWAGCPNNHENFSEIIIDEAQDLGPEYFDRISNFRISYGADDAQIVFPDHCSRTQELKERFPNNVDHVLDKNFRSTLAIMKFAKVAFSRALITQNILDALRDNPGEKPSLIATYGNPRYNLNAREIRNNAIREIINACRDETETNNIAILLPFKNSVDEYHELLRGMDINHSMYYEDTNVFPHGCPEIDNVHITTYKSAKGMEFDAVIIPDFGSMDYLCENYEVLEWKDFFVAVTRARASLYLFSNNEMPELNEVVE